VAQHPPDLVVWDITQMRRQQRPVPLRVAFRLGGVERGQNPGVRGGILFALAPAARGVRERPQAQGGKPPPHLTHRGRAEFQARRQGLVFLIGGRPEEDVGPLHRAERRSRAPQECAELDLFRFS